MSILNGRSVKRYSGFSPDIIKTFVKPAIAAVIMGVITKLIYMGIHAAVGSNAAATITAIIAAIILYAILLVATRTLTEAEILHFPKGLTIVKIFKKAHLL